MDKINPKKSLGQNFLTDKNIAKRIVDLLAAAPDDVVLEIGPGMGVLTDFLVDANVNLTSVELDKRAIEYLKDKFKAKPKFNLVNSDILKFDLLEFAMQSGKRINVIGNIPYNISTEIFFMLFENASYINRAVLTVQKEVARRIAATNKHKKEYGVTSLARAITSSAKIAFDIAGGSFHPPPKVTSSVIVLNFHDEQQEIEQYNKLMKLVRAAFSQRRKMLRNALSVYLQSKDLKLEEFDDYCQKNNLIYMTQRAEQLSLEDYEILLRSIEDFGSTK